MLTVSFLFAGRVGVVGIFFLLPPKHPASLSAPPPHLTQTISSPPFTFTSTSQTERLHQSVQPILQHTHHPPSEPLRHSASTSGSDLATTSSTSLQYSLMYVSVPVRVSVWVWERESKFCLLRWIHQHMCKHSLRHLCPLVCMVLKSHTHTMQQPRSYAWRHMLPLFND